MEGATTEISPLQLLDIKLDTRLATGTLSDNRYGWTKYGNLLFVDQPGPVGYSFGSRRSSSTQAASDVVGFLEGWLKLFPEFENRPLFISGKQKTKKKEKKKKERKKKERKSENRVERMNE